MITFWSNLTKYLVRSLHLNVSFLEYCAALSKVSWDLRRSMIWSSSETFSWYSCSICFLSVVKSFSRSCLSWKRNVKIHDTKHVFWQMIWSSWYFSVRTIMEELATVSSWNRNNSYILYIICYSYMKI